MELNPPLILKLINTCCRIKAKIVERDEREEKGLRTILNLGHTLAHALEASSKYKKISHGQAVSIGLLYAAGLSLALGKCDKKKVDAVREIIEAFGLPVDISFDYPKLLRAFKYDKKFISGKVRMVLIKDIGNLEITDGIPLKKIEGSLRLFNGKKCRSLAL
jgi:3-dehydroquinate synthase